VPGITSGLRFVRGTFGVTAITEDSLPDIKFGPLVGTGSFGKVYRGALRYLLRAAGWQEH
jgi:hypothetical protein